MQFGLDVGIYGRLAAPEVLVPLARTADESGFHSLWLADHVVFPAKMAPNYPYTPSGQFPVDLHEPILEPIATMGILVAVTERVKIGTAVLVMPYRNPVLLAKMLITYDVFSRGRIVLGAGVGWLEEEFEALNAPSFTRRGQVTDEYLDLFKRLCQGGEVSFSGDHYHLAPVFANPPSLQRPHIPVVVGGMSDAALRRVARHGNGWLSLAFKPERLPERLAALERACERGERPFTDISLNHKLFVNIGEPQPSVFGGRDPGTGSVAEIRDDLKGIADLGYDQVIVRYRGEDPGAQLEQLKRFTDEIVAKL